MKQETNCLIETLRLKQGEALFYRPAANRLEELQQELTEAIRERNKTVADLIKQRDEALFDREWYKRIATTRQEPSRLEIAALLLTHGWAERSLYENAPLPGLALKSADALIAAAKGAK